MRRVMLVFVAALVVAAVLMPDAAHATNVAKTELLYGDSLIWESTWAIHHPAGWTESLHDYPGTALCDWTGELAEDLATARPVVVGVETAGNSTRPCMVDANGNQLGFGSDAYYARYRADMNTFAATVTATGAKLVFIVAPPFLGSAGNTALIELESIEEEVAATYPGVSVSLAPRNAVSNNGVYAATKPCLGTETAAMGCVNGQIAIRTNVGAQTGVHFCPTGLEPTFPFACDEYSSGEKRFGNAVGSTLVKPPRPIRPTVTMTGASGVEGSMLTFQPSLVVPYSQDLALCYSTSDGTAKIAAGDYTAASGCFVIPAWSTSGPTIAVSTLLDQTREHAEAFKLKVWGESVPITRTTKTVTVRIAANLT